MKRKICGRRADVHLTEIRRQQDRPTPLSALCGYGFGPSDYHGN